MTPLQKLLEENGYECESYSGRGMYGKTCLGVVVENFNKLLAVIISNVDSENQIEISESIECMKTDSRGKTDLIVYFPDTQYYASKD